jgi:hypothetical protein
MESLPVEPAMMALAAISFLAGLACTALAVYLFSRKKELRALGMPAWAPVLALGALLTLIVPCGLIFLLYYVMTTPTPPPPPTCYAPKPPTCYDVAPAAMAGLVLGRRELLERLKQEGKISDGVYRRIKDAGK